MEKSSTFGELRGYSRKLAAKPEEESNSLHEVLLEDTSSQAISSENAQSYIQSVLTELGELRNLDLEQDIALDKITSIIRLLGKSQNVNILGFLEKHRQLAIDF